MPIKISDIKITPQPVARGAKIKGSCRVTTERVEVVSVVAIEPTGPQHTLCDDGTHGDEITGDEIYTLEEYIPFNMPLAPIPSPSAPPIHEITKPMKPYKLPFLDIENVVSEIASGDSKI